MNISKINEIRNSQNIKSMKWSCSRVEPRIKRSYTQERGNCNLIHRLSNVDLFVNFVFMKI